MFSLNLCCYRLQVVVSLILFQILRQNDNTHKIITFICFILLLIVYFCLILFLITFEVCLLSLSIFIQPKIIHMRLLYVSAKIIQMTL